MDEKEIRQEIVELAQKWEGHNGVNWETTTTENLLILISDAIDQDKYLIEEAKKKQISGFYEEQYPSYEQGEPHHELQSLVTAEECNRLVDKIKEHEVGAEYDKFLFDSNGHPLLPGDAALGFASYIPIQTGRELAAKLTKALTTIEEQNERLKWLDALEAAGVDNWEGYDMARELMNDE